jgi:hypothetical protein
MRLDADEEDEQSFNKSPPGPTGQHKDVEEGAEEARPVSQGTTSTETETAREEE